MSRVLIFATGCKLLQLLNLNCILRWEWAGGCRSAGENATTISGWLRISRGKARDCRSNWTGLGGCQFVPPSAIVTVVNLRPTEPWRSKR